MNRFRIPEIFLGCFLTIAVFAMGELFARQEQAASPKQTVKKEVTADQGHKAESPDVELTGSTWLTKDAAGFFTFLLVAVGGGQAILFFIQLRYMRRGMEDAAMVARAAVISAEAAKRSADHIPNVERAYVFFASATCEGLASPSGEVMVVKYSFKNSGRTPAILNRIQIGVGYLEGIPSGAEFTYGDEGLPAPLVVGSDRTEPENDVQLWITADDFEKARIGTGRIFFWGKLTYLDVFGASHETGICSEWHFVQRRFVISTDCPELNYNN